MAFDQAFGRCLEREPNSNTPLGHWPGELLFEGVCFAYERHPKSVRTVWWVRAASRVSTSGAAADAGSVPQIGFLLIDLAPEAPPKSSPQSSYHSLFCSFETLQNLFVKEICSNMVPKWSRLDLKMDAAHPEIINS